MKIRAARAEDQDAVQSIWAASKLPRASRNEWRVLIEGDCAALLVAEDEGEVQGAAVIAFDGWRAFIYHVAVSADARRKGVGRELMAEGERRLRRRGAHTVFALVNESMTDGLALLGASGYEPEGDVAFVKML